MRNRKGSSKVAAGGDVLWPCRDDTIPVQPITRSLTGCARLVAGAKEFTLRRGGHMPEKETIERAQEDAREGKSPSTQAGEFVREEIHHVREGKHGVRSPQQAIAIGLSKARRAGGKLGPPPQGRTSATNRKHA